MGTFRLLLAVFVVIAHTQGYTSNFKIDLGVIAVSVFFFISGYLMPLAFESNYQFSSFVKRVKNYAINRFLRIYPAYWVSLILYLVISRFHQNAITKESLSHVSTYLQNLLLIGLNQSHLWGGYFRFNNPAWSLDVELQYYILVPLLLLGWHRKRNITVPILIIASLASAYLLWSSTHIVDIDRSLLAWSLVFFAGFLFYKSSKTQALFRKVVPPIIAFSLCMIIAILSRELRTVAFTTALISVAGHLLVLQKERRFGRFDAKLGDLSYPVYVFHIFVVAKTFSFISKYYAPLDASPTLHFSFLALANIVATLIAAYMITVVLVYPIERLRKKRKAETSIDGFKIEPYELVKPTIVETTNHASIENSLTPDKRN